MDTESLETERPAAATVDLDLLGAPALVDRLCAAYDVVGHAVRGALPALAAVLEEVRPRWQRGGRLLLAGAGTSGRMAAVQAAECPPTFGLEEGRVVPLVAGGLGALARAVGGAEDDADAGEAAARAVGAGPLDTLVAISASGTAPFVRAALAAARAKGALGVAITANPGSPLAAEADHALELRTGPEPVAGSTRMLAGSAQKMALDLLTTALMVQVGHVYGNRMVDFVPSNTKLRRRAVEMVTALAGVDAAAARDVLARTDWRVKPAVVMAVRACDLAAARALLRAAGGSLRRALEGDPDR